MWTASWLNCAPTQMLFTAELRRRLPGGCGVVAAAVHPGEVMTDVVRTLPRPLQAAYRVAMLPFCLTPKEGARGFACADLLSTATRMLGKALQQIAVAISSALLERQIGAHAATAAAGCILNGRAPVLAVAHRGDAGPRFSDLLGSAAAAPQELLGMPAPDLCA